MHNFLFPAVMRYGDAHTSPFSIGPSMRFFQLAAPKARFGGGSGRLAPLASGVPLGNPPKDSPNFSASYT
jgi:hypothetical protein